MTTSHVTTTTGTETAATDPHQAAEPPPYPEPDEVDGSEWAQSPVDRPRRPRRPRAPAPPALRLTAATLSLLGLLIVGFFVYFYGLSGLAEQRDQTVLDRTFAGQLALATAPVGPTAVGSPVALLSIPALGISHLVVVEGTTSEQLAHGPGHLRSTVLPGQAGVSVVYGRVAGFGGPFAHLMQLNRGDRITVTTGQGVSTYVVESFGTSAQPTPDHTANRLVLETGNSSLVPQAVVEVSADLITTALPSPGGLPQTTVQENALAGDPGALVALLLWSQALLLLSVGGTVAACRWSARATYLCAAPVAISLVWLIYENLAILLPNLN